MENAAVVPVIVTVLVVSVVCYPAHGVVIETDVLIVGAGAAGLQAGKTLTDAGFKKFEIVEATGRIGGRIRNYATFGSNATFRGLSIELGANWVQGVGGKYGNPIIPWADAVDLRTFKSFFDNATGNIYDKNGFVDPSNSSSSINLSDEVHDRVIEFSEDLRNKGLEDISTLTAQRFFGRVPSTPVDMVIDYFNYDWEYAEPPRVTSLKNTQPFQTAKDFGPDFNFVADQRGYAVILDPLSDYLKRTNGSITDPRLRLNTTVNKIDRSRDDDSVTVYTEEGLVTYKAKAVILTVSIGVLQSKLIEYVPDLPMWKLSVIFQFDMAIYTKIFLKFPYTFWPTGPGTEFFLYADEKRGYYPIWQHLEKEYPGYNLLVVTVTDDESRRIEQLSEDETLSEIMLVLKTMFKREDIPDATDIFYHKWGKDKFFRGAYSNWPIGVSSYEYKQLQAPVGRLYFSGEGTSVLYNGYIHGALTQGENTAKEVLECLKDKSFCNNNLENNTLTKQPLESCGWALNFEHAKATRHWSNKVDDLQKKLFNKKCT